MKVTIYTHVYIYTFHVFNNTFFSTDYALGTTEQQEKKTNSHNLWNYVISFLSLKALYKEGVHVGAHLSAVCWRLPELLRTGP